MSRSSVRSLRGIGAIAVTALLLAGCAGLGANDKESTEDSEPVSGGTLTFGRTASANDLDLNQQITANNAFAIDKIFEPLVSFDEDGKIIPWLAAKYEESEDGLTYAFALRDGLQFSDGTDVTPDDVVFSLQRHRKVGGPLPIEAPIKSIEATGDHEVTITLKSAYTPFLSELSNFSNGIFPKDFGGKSEKTFFQAPIGTGPFVVDDFDPDGDLSFVKNEHYWQQGQPYLDKLVYKVIADDTQLRQQLSAGQIDAIDEVPAANAAQVDQASATELSKSDGWSTEQVFFNTQRKQFADQHVRRAISYAIDREGITKATTFDTATPAVGLLPPAIEYAAKGDLVGEYDLAKAKAELAESAYADGFTASLLIPSGNSQRAQIAQIIQESLEKLGITVKIEQIDIASFRERFMAYDYDFMINNGQSDAPDPNGFITFQGDPDGFSKSYWTHYTNAKVTDLMQQGRVTPEGDKRERIYTDIQGILAEDAPYVPLFYPSNLKATTDKVHGFTVLPNGSVRFQDAWIEQ